jgi:hypothetical protein
LAVLMLNVDLNRIVDLRCRRADSWGISVAVRPRRGVSSEEARKTPLGARSAWRGNQRPNLTEPFIKGGFSMAKNNNEDSKKLAGRYYEAKDYEREDTLSSGLAETHEQVSDTYTEGQVNAVIEDVNGKDIPLPQDEHNI